MRSNFFPAFNKNNRPSQRGWDEKNTRRWQSGTPNRDHRNLPLEDWGHWSWGKGGNQARRGLWSQKGPWQRPHCFPETQTSPSVSLSGMGPGTNYSLGPNPLSRLFGSLEGVKASWTNSQS